MKSFTRLTRTATILLASTLFASWVAAEPLSSAKLSDADRESAEYYVPTIDKQLGFANSTCGTSITYDVRWSSFVGHTDDRLNTMGLYGSACSNVLSSLYGICGKDDLGKQTVKASIKQVRCQYDEGATAGPTMRMDGDVLVVGFQKKTRKKKGITQWLVSNLEPPPEEGMPANISLADRRDIRGATAEHLETSLGTMNADCGTEATYDMDWQSFVGKNRKNKNLSTAAAFCGNVMQGVRAACADPKTRRAVASRIKTVRCTWDEGATKAKLGVDRPTLKIEGGVLEAGYHWASDRTMTRNTYRGTSEWLPENL